MTANLILGKDTSEQIYAELKERISVLGKKGVVPCLAGVLVGDDPASHIYTRTKSKKCAELGINYRDIILPGNVSQEELLEKIAELNSDRDVHGILVQLPLPAYIDERAVINAINPSKDVDCFHPCNVGKMLIGEPSFLPATPAGVQQMLVRSGVEIRGKHVVVVGRSNIVGKPMAAMLMQAGDGADATVTVVHSNTVGAPDIIRTADILVVAVGRPGFITADMVKDGAVVIDVGTNRISDPSAKNGSRVVGDVDFETVKEKASFITPVPGGVGPMTICMLVSNTVLAAERSVSQ